MKEIMILTNELTAAFDEYQAGVLSNKDYQAIRADIIKNIKLTNRSRYGFAMAEGLK